MSRRGIGGFTAARTRGAGDTEAVDTVGGTETGTITVTTTGWTVEEVITIGARGTTNVALGSVEIQRESGGQSISSKKLARGSMKPTRYQ